MATKRVKIPFEIEIPAHWKAVTNRGIFKEYNVRGMDQLQLLSVSQRDGVVLQTEITTKKDTSNDNKANYKHVKGGDIVYNKMRMWQGAVGVSKYEGIVSPAYVILRAIRNDVDPEYFHYQYRTKFYIKQSGIYSYGLCDDMNSLRYEDFKNMKSILPPIDDQKDIVKRITHYNEAINEFIRKKERYIELLKEYKQSKINELVTKGLDPNVKMKDSGIEWLGQIPAHWEVIRLKIIASINPIIRTKSLNPDLPVVFLPMESVEEDGTYKNEASKITSEISTGYTYFEKGDIIIAKITPCFENRKGALLDTLKSEYGFGTTELHVVRGKRGANLKYLFYLLRSELFMRLGEMNMKGTAGQKRVPDTFIKTYKLALPPISEQEKISQKIEEIESSFNEVEKRSRSQMRIIRKYRQSLIYELVTGKRKP